MSNEVPIQVDLSNENSWNEIDSSLLTTDEKRLLSEHFQEESEGIIYLTQQELGELKQALSYENNHHRDRSEIIDEFITTQVAEGLSMNDIILHNENIPDILKNSFQGEIENIEAKAQEILFGSEGMFSALNISPIAQDHLSASLAIAGSNKGLELMQKKLEDGTLTSQDIEELLAFSQDIEEKFQNLKGILDMTENVPGSPVAMMPKVYVSNQGESNEIFMNTSAGNDFFTKIFTGEINPENLESTLEEANKDFGVPIQNDITPVSESLNASLTQISNTMKSMDETAINEAAVTLARNAAQENATTTVTPDVSTDSPEEKSFFEQILEAIKNLLSKFVNLDEKDNPTERNDDSENKEGEDDIEEENDLSKEMILKKISEGAFPDMSQESLKAFFENDESMERFFSILKDIPTHNGQDTSGEKIENLFFTNIESDETRKIDAFILAGDLESYKNADGSLNPENLFKILTEYKDYRLQHIDDTTLSYKSYFENSSD